MELVKSNIHMSKNAGKAAMEVYINEELNVSEVNPQMANVIREEMTPTVESLNARQGQGIINGRLNYKVLYYTDNSEVVYGIEGEIPFEESIRLPGVDENARLSARLVVDSSSIKMINPRKFILKAQITAYVDVEKMEDVEMVRELKDVENTSALKEQVEALSLVVDKSDVFQVKDDISVASGKPAIYKIVWKDIKLKNVATRLMEGRVHIGGEISIFVMYVPDDDKMPNQWMESCISFGGTVDVKEAMEDMISYINVELHDVKIDVNEDSDGENRELGINALLKLDIKIYEEKEMEIISDVYSPHVNLIPVCSKQTYKRLLVKNASRTKNTVKLAIDQSKGHILQICSSGADVKIENVTVSDNGLLATGKMKAYVLYVSSNDTQPVCAAWEEVEFKHRIDAEGITQEDEYYINWRVEQVNANMLSTDEIEVKAVVVLEAIVFKNMDASMITDISEEEFDLEKISELPGIKGYVVQEGDTLWKIAKDNYTTVENIMAINNLQSDQIKKGDRLIIVKSCQC